METPRSHSDEFALGVVYLYYGAITHQVTDRCQAQNRFSGTRDHWNAVRIKIPQVCKTGDFKIQRDRFRNTAYFPSLNARDWLQNARLVHTLTEPSR